MHQLYPIIHNNLNIKALSLLEIVSSDKKKKHTHIIIKSIHKNFLFSTLKY